jgi:hypothetical protein
MATRKRPNRFELDMFKLFGRHDVRVVECEARTFVVECSCGFVAPAPYGEVHALKILNRHLSAYGLAPDPHGAKYV